MGWVGNSTAILDCVKLADIIAPLVIALEYPGATPVFGCLGMLLPEIIWTVKLDTLSATDPEI